MLYPSKLISEERLETDAPEEMLPAPACFLTAVRSLNQLFGESPVPMPTGGRSTTLLYRDAVYLWQDIAQQAGPLAALAPMTFFGVTEGRETVQLSFRLEGRTLIARRRSDSGREFERLQGLAMRMEWPDRESAAWMRALAVRLPARAVCCAACGRDRELLHPGGLLVPTPGSLFTYLAWEPVSTPDLLACLTAEHKTALWRRFLEDDRQPLEFDWLWDAYYGAPLDLLEWTLTLHGAMEELGFRVERTPCSFRVTDQEGRERRFDFSRGGPAERVFLKLLFPLDEK